MRGLRIVVSVPALILFFGTLGYGALARDLGYSLGQALFVNATLYALPAQVLLVDQLARGASIAAAAFVVSLTGIRMLPMAVSLLPWLRRPGERWRFLHLLAVHCTAITTWVEGSRQLPDELERLRLYRFLGIATGTFTATVSGTIAGFFIAAAVPTALSAALLMMTPLYFFTSLLQSSRVTMDRLSVVLGALLGPVLFMVAPGPDLLLTGLIGGTIAYLTGKKHG